MGNKRRSLINKGKSRRQAALESLDAVTFESDLDDEEWDDDDEVVESTLQVRGGTGSHYSASDSERIDAGVMDDVTGELPSVGQFDEVPVARDDVQSVFGTPPGVDRVAAENEITDVVDPPEELPPLVDGRCADPPADAEETTEPAPAVPPAAQTGSPSGPKTKRVAWFGAMGMTVAVVVVCLVVLALLTLVIGGSSTAPAPQPSAPEPAEVVAPSEPEPVPEIEPVEPEGEAMEGEQAEEVSTAAPVARPAPQPTWSPEPAVAPSAGTDPQPATAPSTEPAPAEVGPTPDQAERKGLFKKKKK